MWEIVEFGQKTQTILKTIKVKGWIPSLLYCIYASHKAYYEHINIIFVKKSYITTCLMYYNIS